MSIISIRLNDDEERIIKNYIKTKGLSVSQYIKDLLFEKIEDEYDLGMVQDYLKRKKEGTLELISFEEASKEWGID